MPIYNAPLRDIEFNLYELLNIEQYSSLAGFSELSRDLVSALHGEGERFCRDVLLPLNQTGDAEGLKHEDGNVIMPSGFREAYAQYVQGGWTSFTCDPEYGGQGLPEVVNMPIVEMICSTNMAFGLTPGLSHGAYNAIHMHGSDEQKQKWLPRMVTGEWAGVMCLTEPQCGTDLGLIRTKAVPNEDGSYAITGTKIFISSGEQDMTENIIHLVLAKLPDAPSGTRGISLFIVPKVMVGDDGSLGERNGVRCDSIEHKMGIHASPTCVMNYENATGWLVGTAHQGLKYMFTMMNEARLWVGVQGLGVGEIAYQNALAYAKERLQGRALTGPAEPTKPADPIIVHPDVKRMLLTCRAFAEGGRSLAMMTALKTDLLHRATDPAEKEAADHFVQLMTPIVKAYLTDGGSETANTALQVFGGYGYITEYGMEQYVRDARIAQIYEGTNGIQALDLIGRKLSKQYGKYLRQFFHPVTELIAEHEGNAEMKPFIKPLARSVDFLQKATIWIAQTGLAKPDEPAASAVEYLRMFALVTLGWIWARSAHIALEAKKAGNTDPYYDEKLITARFFMEKILPQTNGLVATVTNGSAGSMAFMGSSMHG